MTRLCLQQIGKTKHKLKKPDRDGDAHPYAILVTSEAKARGPHWFKDWAKMDKKTWMTKHI